MKLKLSEPLQRQVEVTKSKLSSGIDAT